MKTSIKLIGVTAMLFTLLSSQKAYAHCEIPCGIYGDSLRIALIYEHIATIEKSMKKIDELSKDPQANANQLVRWVMNKEEHAVKIQEIVSQYFMHQRIKPVDPENKEAYKMYVKQLALLHQISVYAMKAKQGTDDLYIDKMKNTVHNFEHAYF